MKTWMTISDLSEYLQIPESKIRSFTRNKRIPFHDNRGFLRFHRPEIDEWMKSPLQDVSLERGGDGGDEDDADDTRDGNQKVIAYKLNKAYLFCYYLCIICVNYVKYV